MSLKYVLITVVVATLLQSCSGVSISRLPTKYERHEIEKLARIKLPPSSKDIQFHTESGIDRLVMLRFVIDKKDLNTFLVNAGYNTPLQSGFRPFNSGLIEDISWWNPEQAKQVSGGYIKRKDWASRVMVDNSGEEAIVYLRAFEL